MLNNDKHFDIGKLTEEVLITPPNISLSENFADAVAKKAVRRFALEEYLKEFFIYTAAIIGLIATTGAVAYFWLEPGWNKLFNIITSNIVTASGIVVLILFVLFADKVLLRYCFFRYSDKRLSQ